MILGEVYYRLFYIYVAVCFFLCSTLSHYYVLLFVIFQLRDLSFSTFFLCLFSCFVFLFLYLFSILCIPCLCIFCIVSPSVYKCLFPIFVQVYRPLPPCGNPTAINKYLTSYIWSLKHVTSSFRNGLYSGFMQCNTTDYWLYFIQGTCNTLHSVTPTVDILSEI